jgi:hypothetical protein
MLSVGSSDISRGPWSPPAGDRPRRLQRAGDPVLRLGGLPASVGVMRRYERDVDGAGWHGGLLIDMLAETLHP